MNTCTCPKDGSRYCAWCQALALRANLLLAPTRALAPAQRPPEGNTEDDLTDALRRYCKARGFLAYHTHNSKRSAPGFPDWAIINPADPSPTLFLWELKRQSQSAQPSGHQQQWLDALARVTRVHAALYRPSDWEEIMTHLQVHG